MTGADDLVAWLTGVLDEDEQAVRAVLDHEEEHWRNGDEGVHGARNLSTVVCHPYGWIDAVGQHIARHDPAAVLADIAAKRDLIADLAAEKHRVVEDCWYTCAAATEERDGGTTCNEHESKSGPCNCGRDERVARRLRILASAYAGRPGYRQEWAL